MTLEAQYGNFQAEASTGSKAYTSVTDFTPKAMFFWATAQTGFGSYGVDSILGFGASDASDEYCGATYFEDGAAVSNTARRHVDRAFTIFDAAQNVEIEFEVTAFTSTGFTLNYIVAGGDQYRIHWIAWGGDDIQEAEVGYFQTPTSTGTQKIDLTGDFEPDVYILFTARDGNNNPAVAPDYTPNGEPRGDTATNAAHHMVGWAAKEMDNSTGYSMAGCSEDNVADPVQFHIMSGRVAATLIFKSGSIVIDGQANHYSFDSDGFTIDWTDAPTRDEYMGYIAIKGGRWKAAVEVSPASTTGNQAYTGYGFPPKGIMALNAHDSAGSPSTMVRNTIGAGTGASERGYAGILGRGSFVEGDQITKNDKVIACLYNSAGTPTLTEEADLDSLDQDGFTLDWTTCAAAQLDYYILAFGDSLSPLNQDVPDVRNPVEVIGY